MVYPGPMGASSPGLGEEDKGRKRRHNVKTIETFVRKILHPPTYSCLSSGLHSTPTVWFRESVSRTRLLMEALISQFTILSDQALQDKSFDPSTIEDLMKFFEIEAYKSWAAMELEHEMEVKEAEIAAREAEDYLDSVMEDAMDEFRRFEQEMERLEKAELHSLEQTADGARNMGKLMEKAATIASKRYMEAALSSATASMKAAWKGLSSNKVHPSQFK